MKHELLSKSAVLAIFLLFSGFSFAQTGKITGKITDKKTGEAMIGLSVKIKGTTRGASTNVDGRYVIQALTAGKYVLDFSYLGYATKSISEVEVKSGQTATLDVVMEESSARVLAEVVITGTARQESVNTLYAAQKNRAAISDGISSDMITRSPDRSTGEVLKRVSGTTIQDNKFVVVRGLGDRYNNARLDNSSLPSTEPNRKAFSFDIVPSNLVDNIVISKTATPDLPGDFAGGSIQIVTKDMPSSNFFTINLGSGWNSQSTFKDFNFGPRYASDYFAFDNHRNLPTGGSFPKNAAATDALTSEQNIKSLLRMPRVWSIKEAKAAPSQNHQLSLGRVMDFQKGGRFGYTASLTYRNSQNVSPDLGRDWYSYNYNDRVNVFSTNIGALANFSYTKGKSKISFKNMYNRILEDKVTFRSGEDRSRSSDVNYYAFDLLQKGLVKTTLEGEHQLFGKHKFNWNGSFANIINDQPDQRKISYQRSITDRGTNQPFIATATTINKETNRFFSTLNEDLINGGINDQFSFKLFSQTATFKTGLSGMYRQRDFSARLMGMVLQEYNADILSRPITTLFSKDLLASGVYRLEEITRSTDKYSANSFTGAGYAMLDNKLGKNGRIVWGVRAEKFDLSLDSYLLTGTPSNLSKNYLDILPSVNYTYSLSPKSNLRASYYRTLARPEFRELAPFDYYDYELLAVVQGNSKLERTQIDNADIRYEIYPGTGQVLSVSGFYKRFTNAIEPSIYDVNSTPTISYFNTKKATTFGAEIEFRRSLSFLGSSDLFKNTTFYANGSLIKSNVENPEGAGFLRDKRPMVGQSPYTINAGLQNNAFNNKLNLSVLYNRIGKRITNVGGQRLIEVWENPRNVLDFQANYRFLKNEKMQLKLNVSDILNNPSVFYFDYTKDGKYSPGKIVINPTTSARERDEVLSKFKTGTNVSLSLSYNIGK